MKPLFNRFACCVTICRKASALLALCISFLFIQNANAVTHTVTTTANAGAGSFKDKIALAASGDTIKFSAGLNTLPLTYTGSVSLNKSLTIIGNGITNTIIDGGNADRMFIINTGYTLRMQQLTARNFGGFFLGGGVFLNKGATVLLDNCSFTGNKAINAAFMSTDANSVTVANQCTFDNNTANSSPGLYNGYYSSLTLTNSTISNNSATGANYAHAGAIMNFFGILSINNCTFFNNRTNTGWGGAIYYEGGSNDGLIVTNSTFSGNSAVNGGAIYISTQSAPITLRNNIIADNTATNGPDVDIPFFVNYATPAAYNLIGDNSDIAMPSGNGNILGTTISPINPMLGALGNNGGATQTMALQCGSPAINAADPASTAADQRGVAVFGGRKDIGAFESNFNVVNACPSNIIVASAPDACGATVTFIAPSGNAITCQAATTVQQTAGLQSESVFPVGTTTNTFLLIYANGAPEQCSFTVTVTDNTAPSFGSSASTLDIVISGGGYLDEVSWTLTDATNTVVASGGPYYGSPNTHSVDLTTGPYSFFLETQGTFGDNEADYTISCSGTVLFSGTVLGNNSTTVNSINCSGGGGGAYCPSSITVPASNGCEAFVQYGQPAATDNCPVTLTQTNGLASGVLYPLGSTTNTFTATDPSGNTATCTFTVVITSDDSDGDGTPDCADACPYDPNKTAPGNCGCDIPEENHWITGSWSSCSETCGDGVETRVVSCIDCNGNLKPDFECPGQKPVTTQPCNLGDCCQNFTWGFNEWSTCSAVCGGGTQSRSVYCLDCDGNVTSDGFCANQPKPATQQVCNTQSCCDIDWVVGEWAQCSEQCDYGTQTRTVICKDCQGLPLPDGSCSTTKPSTTQACGNAPLELTLTPTNNPCNGDCIGRIDALASGGVPPYFYSWDNGSFGDYRDKLCKGEYGVTVYDANQCSTTATMDITEPDAILLTADFSNPSCTGLCDGFTKAIPLGGTQPFTFLWDNGETTARIESLCADVYDAASGGYFGEYHCIATDVNGCIAEFNFTLIDPLPLELTLLEVRPTCYGSCDGAIDLIAEGVATTLTVNWSNPDPSTVELDVNTYGNGVDELTYVFGYFCAGIYTFDAVDGNGCTATESIEVFEPELLQLELTSVNPICHGGNGFVTQTTTGGTSPYKYYLLTGGDRLEVYFDPAYSIGAGTYEFQVEDANGCTANDIIEIIEPELLQLSLTSVNPICHGLCTGSIDLTVTGGTAPIMGYNWSNDTYTEDQSGLCAGIYSVTVYDSYQCSATASVEITQPDFISINVSTVSNPTCFGACDGFAEVESITGGIPPYSYEWLSYNDLQTIGTDFRLEGLCGNENAPEYDSDGNLIIAGTYFFAVSDANGCEESIRTVLIEPELLQLELLSTNPLCHGGYGTITPNATGGTQPYTYWWWHGGAEAFTSTLSLTAGTYSITVTDANGCSAIETVEIIEPGERTLNIIVSNPTCFGSCDGFLDASGSMYGGDEIYWSTGATTASISFCSDDASPPGGYSSRFFTATVTDVNGCSFTDTIGIDEPELLSLNLTTVNPLCHGGDVAVTGSASGGTEPYTYYYYTAAGDRLEVYFDPAYSVAPGTTHEFEVEDANGCKNTSALMGVEPDEIDFTAYMDEPTCPDDCDGQIMLVINGGGTAPYKVQLPDGSIVDYEDFVYANGLRISNVLLENLCAGDYDFLIVDNNGCTTEVNTPYFDYKLQACINPCDSFIVEIDTSSGAGAWDILGSITYIEGTFTGTGFSFNGGPILSSDDYGNGRDFSYIVSPGEYELCVYGYYTNTNGDTDTCTVCQLYNLPVIDEPLTVGTSVVNASCSNTSDGSIDLTVTGSAGIYEYAWSNGSTTEDQSGLFPGTYSFTITSRDRFGNVTETNTGTLTVSADTTATIWYVDADGDGFGNDDYQIEACEQPDGYVDNNSDCNDSDASIFPGATELCNGIDDNCNGQIDEGTLRKKSYPDLDGDGKGDASHPGAVVCKDAPGWVSNNDDCDDTNPDVHKGAKEICDGLDNDCNGKIDDKLKFDDYYVDADGDGKGDAGSVAVSSCESLDGYVKNDDDCDDRNPSIYKHAPEICGNGIDDDCNGKIDDRCPKAHARTSDPSLADGFEDEKSISIYPNPFTNEFNIQFDGFENTEVNISIVNALGQVVLERKEKVDLNTINTFDFSSYATGIYTINVSSTEINRVYRVIKEN